MSDAATAEEATRLAREDLLDRVRSDPALGARERETTFAFASDETRAHVHTEEPAIIRRLLAHEGVHVGALGVFDGDRRRTLTLEETLAEADSDDPIVRLKGRVPVRYLTVATVGRSHDEHAPVVSGEVFGE